MLSHPAAHAPSVGSRIPLLTRLSLVRSRFRRSRQTNKDTLEEICLNQISSTRNLSEVALVEVI